MNRLAAAAAVAAVALMPCTASTAQSTAQSKGTAQTGDTPEFVTEESLPVLGPHSDLDLLVGRFFFWADILQGRTNRITISRSAEAITGMLEELRRLGRYDEAVKAAFRLREVANPGIPLVHQALAHAALAEVERGGLGEADRVLGIMRSLEGKDHQGGRASAWAMVRFQRLFAASSLHLARGAPDLARVEWQRMKDALAEFEAAVRNEEVESGGPDTNQSAAHASRSPWAILSEVELDLLMGSGQFEGCWRRASELLLTVAPGPGQDEAAENLGARARRALHLASYGNGSLVPEALSVHLARSEDENVSRGARRSAAIVAARIGLHTGSIGAAEEALDRARRLSDGTVRDVEIEILEGRVELERDGVLGEASRHALEGRSLGLMRVSGAGRRGLLQSEQHRAFLAADLLLAGSESDGTGDAILARYLEYESAHTHGEDSPQGGQPAAVERARAIRKRLLGKGDCLLIPVPSDTVTSMLLVTQEGCRAFKASPGCVFRAAANDIQWALRQRSQDPQSKADLQGSAAATLGKCLFPHGLMQALEGAKLITVVQAALGPHHPIELAVVEDPLGAQRPLGEAFPIAWAPTVQALDSIEAPSPVARPNDFALVASDAGGGDAAEELRGIASVFGPFAGSYLGDEGSEEHIHAGLLGSSKVGLVIGRGWRDPNSGVLSAIDLDSAPMEGQIEVGLWRAAEMEPGCVPEVLLLATFDAGAATARRGHHPANGLGHACLRSGSQAVLLVRDDLSLHCIIAFAAEFAVALARGDSVAHAAQTARGVIREDARFTASFSGNQVRVLGNGSYAPFPGGVTQPSALARPRWLLGSILAVSLGAMVLATIAARRVRGTKGPARG